jgi:hypothetical protein
MLTMRHVAPFARQAASLRTQLSNTSDTLEQWSKVQTLWCGLESVFLGGDIARQVRQLGVSTVTPLPCTLTRDVTYPTATAVEHVSRLTLVVAASLLRRCL